MYKPSSRELEAFWIESDWLPKLAIKGQSGSVKSIGGMHEKSVSDVCKQMLERHLDEDERIMQLLHDNQAAKWIVGNIDFQAFRRRQLRSRSRACEGDGYLVGGDKEALKRAYLGRAEKQTPEGPDGWFWLTTYIRVPPAEDFYLIRATAYALSKTWGIEKPLSASAVISTSQSLLSHLSALESGIAKLKSIDEHIYCPEREKDFDYLRRRLSLLVESAGKSSWNQGKNALTRYFVTQFISALRHSGEQQTVNAMAILDLVRVADSNVDISVETAQRFLDSVDWHDTYQDEAKKISRENQPGWAERYEFASGHWKKTK